MKRTLLTVLPMVLILWATGSLAQGSNAHLRYAVDPATAVPTATVVQNSEGVTVVLFRVPAITGGAMFSFRLDLTSGSAKVTYPVTADVQDQGNGKLDAAFDPPEVVLNAPNVEASTFVTVTVAASGDGAHKLKTQVKAEVPKGSRLGKGPGVKVVVMQGATASAAPEEQMLLDVQDALSPDSGDCPESPRPE